MAREYFGHTAIEANADLDALWAAIAGVICGQDGSPLTVRYMAFPFGDEIQLPDVGADRPLLLRGAYTILGWYLQAFDANGLPTPVTCAFSITRRLFDDTAADPVGAGTPPSLAAQSKNFGDPTDWASLLGDAKDTVIAQLANIVPGSAATTILLTLIVQDRVPA